MQNRSDTSTIRKKLYENVFICFVILRDFSRMFSNVLSNVFICLNFTRLKSRKIIKHLKTFSYNFFLIVLVSDLFYILIANLIGRKNVLLFKSYN